MRPAGAHPSSFAGDRVSWAAHGQSSLYVSFFDV